jgi:hypothetical protein
MGRPIAVPAVLVSALLVGCGRPPDDSRSRIAALEARLDRLEKRLEAGEDRLAAIATLQATIQDLQRRLAAAEARSVSGQPAEPTTPPSASAEHSAPSPAMPMTRDQAAAAWSGLRGPGGDAKRAAVAELGTELQARLAKIREQHGDVPPAERLQAVREAHRWYRERLRALLRGEGTGAGGADAPAK